MTCPAVEAGFFSLGVARAADHHGEFHGHVHIGTIHLPAKPEPVVMDSEGTGHPVADLVRTAGFGQPQVADHGQGFPEKRLRSIGQTRMARFLEGAPVLFEEPSSRLIPAVDDEVGTAGLDVHGHTLVGVGAAQGGIGVVNRERECQPLVGRGGGTGGDRLPVQAQHRLVGGVKEDGQAPPIDVAGG